MTNETIKRNIRKVLQEKDIIINCISFSKVKRENERISIGKITLSLDSIDNVGVDTLKMAVDDYLDENNIDYMGLLLDI